MIQWVWEAVSRARIIEPAYVATDSPEIYEYCASNHIGCLMTRSDCRNGTERCHDAMRQLAQRDPDDIVINIQGDEPLIRGEALDDLARAFNDPRVEIASLYFKPQDPRFISDKNRVKVLIDAEGHAIWFGRSIHAAPLWRSYGQHIGVYAYRRRILAQLVNLPASASLEQGAWMDAGYKVKMIETPWSTVAVDTPEDIARVEALMAA